MFHTFIFKLYALFLRHGLVLTLASIALSIVLPWYSTELGPVAVIFWRIASVCVGAWLGNLLYVKYFCDESTKIEDCTTPETHRLYFILGICAVFALR